MATARVLLFKGGARAGPRVERSEPKRILAVHTRGGAYTRQCTHKAVHTQGGLWPPQESCYFRGVGLAGPSRQASSAASRVKVWRSTHKAVHIHCGAHPRRAVATARVLFFASNEASFLSSTASRSEGSAVRTQRSAYTWRSTHKAFCDQQRSLVILGGCGGWPHVKQREPSVERNEPK